jgi:uncharacterized protein YkwD
MRNAWRPPRQSWGLSLMLISVGSLVALGSVAIAAQPPETTPSATNRSSEREEQIAQVIQRRVVPTVISPNVTVPNSGVPTTPTPASTQTRPTSSPQPPRSVPTRTRRSFPIYRTTTPTSAPSAPAQSAPAQSAPRPSTPAQSAPAPAAPRPSAPAQAAPQPSAPPQSVASIDTYRAELLRLTNLERQRAGLRPLTLSTPLGQAAQAHAIDMARNQFFSHTGSNGSSMASRARAVGYAYSYVGENIGAGYVSPEAAVRAWMNSAGHRANILNPNYTEIGFGYTNASGGQYRNYWVQVFGARR